MCRHAGIGGDALHAAPHPSSYQPIGGEEGHLGVVGDQTDAAVGWCVLCDALRAKAAKNLGSLHELDRRAKCVAHSAAQQAPDKSRLDRPALLALAAPCWWVGRAFRLVILGGVVCLRSVSSDNE